MASLTLQEDDVKPPRNKKSRRTTTIILDEDDWDTTAYKPRLYLWWNEACHQLMRSCHEASQSAIHDTRAEGSKVGIMLHMSSEVQLPGGLCGYHEKGRKMSGECHVTLPCDGQS